MLISFAFGHVDAVRDVDNGRYRTLQPERLYAWTWWVTRLPDSQLHDAYSTCSHILYIFVKRRFPQITRSFQSFLFQHLSISVYKYGFLYHRFSRHSRVYIRLNKATILSPEELGSLAFVILSLLYTSTGHSNLTSLSRLFSRLRLLLSTRLAVSSPLHRLKLDSNNLFVAQQSPKPLSPLKEFALLTALHTDRPNSHRSISFLPR